MLAVFYFAVYVGCGLMIVRFLLPGKAPAVRAWLGACLGCALMMWLPALLAFVFRFSVTAHIFALALLGLLTAAAWFFRAERPLRPLGDEDRALIKTLLWVALPLTLIGAYLQWTHILCPAADGSLHAGQSTYGDLPLHLAIATGARNAAFPMDYSILPGQRLAYPFLADTFATSFMLLGASLRFSMVFTGTVLMALTFSGYCILASRMAESRKGAVLAALLFFLNGGLGFLYMVDMQGAVLGEAGPYYGAMGNNQLQSASGLWERIGIVLNGWYQTPANHQEFATYNLRWSNVIADMMVPQRTTLAGWALVLPCLYLLYDLLRPRESWGLTLDKGGDGPTAVFRRRKTDARQAALLGVLAGMLPMVNTHCFLALGLCSTGWMAWDLIHSRRQRKAALLFWVLYGGIAVALAAPQLFTWTFGQAVGNKSFLQFHFNWVNNTGNGLRDGYLWFYIKNIGLPFVLILLSLLEKNEKRRFIASGAFVIFLLAEFIQFQPNEYDNNKLFYIWYMLCAVLAADYAFALLDRLRGLRARPVIAGIMCVLFFSTGVLAVAREMVTDEYHFSKADADAAAWVEQTTEEDAVFLTGDQHINFVSSLAGRRIVCGPDTWLLYHGYDLADRHAEVERFYTDPIGNGEIVEKYGVSYIVVSNQEWGKYPVNTAALDALYALAYDRDGIRIYQVLPDAPEEGNG
ncbi:MAG: hypothetical protein K5919_00415 [Clostridiales bacterium]|nr:hypothetical protein [Clostridiales bacterium]